MVACDSAARLSSKLHPRALALETESAFRVLARARALEAQGRSIVHLEIGQPDFPTPAPAVEAAAAALRAGKTGYGPTPGLPELRARIAEDAGRRRGLGFAAEEVIVTPGAKPILYFTINALAGPGDEVIHPDPCFPVYPSIIRHSGATPVPLKLREANGFRFDAAEFRRLVSPRTRLVILNSPHNPTGGVLSAEDLEVVAAEARARDFVVLSDEIYGRILYEDRGSQSSGEISSIAALPGMRERTVICDGFSKTYAMTGWRLGYGIAPTRFIEAFELYSVNTFSCVTTFAQDGALAALGMDQAPVEAMVAEFRARRDLLVGELNRVPGLRCSLPGGAFYAFPRITAGGISSGELAQRLLEEAGVAALDGSAFGAAGEGFLRFSYANSRANLAEACRRLRAFMAGLERLEESARAR